MDLNLQDETSLSTCLPDTKSSSINKSLFKDKSAITKAVIIAAGNGSRLQGYQNGKPKPLVKVGGVPLLKRVILSAKKIGIRDFVIVLGYQAARIRKSIKAQKLGVRITWVRNLDWRKPNGISVLKAEKFVNDKFFLFMSDHVYDPNILQKVKNVKLAKEHGLLCVDSRLNKISNLDDATKVRTENNQLVNLGKSLTDFNAIDVGIFICTPDIFDALRQSQIDGDYSLSGGIRVLSQEGKMCTLDIGDHFWLDVDTKPDVKHAERILLESTRSNSDGIVAKAINRKISNKITKWLIKTPITPNQISLFNLCLTAFIGWLVSFGTPLHTILGGILFQFASILDGCDGEVAQIKLKDSRLGAFVDTLTDHLSYFFFIIGVTVGAYRNIHDPSVFYITGASLVYLVIALRIGLLYLNKEGSGSLRDLDQDIADLNHSSQNASYLKFFGFVHHLGRRDLFSFGGFLIMLWGNITLFYWGLMGAVNLMSTGVSFSAAALLSQRHNLNLFNPIRRVLSYITNLFSNPEIELQPKKELSE
ncbi:MAG: NTP transferase domain-containing protein [bacterium]